MREKARWRNARTIIARNLEMLALAIAATRLESSGTILTTQISDNAITAPKIAANAITADKILAAAITAGKLAAGAVKAEALDVATLSAITANLGTVIAGLARDAASKFVIDLTNRYIRIEV